LKVDVFTDGSCILHDNGRGGYGALLIYGDTQKELYGGFTLTTNNRAELIAVIISLESLTEACAVTIYSDSRYVTEPINKKWIHNWVKKDFHGIKNSDLWKRLLPLLSIHQVTFQWVKGHNKGMCLGNERADELAAMGASLPNLPIDKRLDKG
jgi:ribonuclease HI